MFLYIMNHLVCYDIWTMEELKGHSSATGNGFHTICHAHPEIQIPSVEITTGPLGQGIANAVGLAIASKNLAANVKQARFRPRPAHDLVHDGRWLLDGRCCLEGKFSFSSGCAFVTHIRISTLLSSK